MSLLRRIAGRRSFWILGAMLVGLGLLHYLTPQQRFPFLFSHSMERHAVERIIFILPVAGATFAFGQAGGVIVLVLAVLIMLPRALLISPYPADALLETVAVGVVGYLVVWMIETQEREKQLRQEAVSRLTTINAVTEEITSELELDRVLPKVLQISEELVGADGGVIALFDQEKNLVGYPYLHNLPQELVDVTASEEEGLAWEVMNTGRPATIEDYSRYPRAIPAFVEAGVTSVVAVPIVSGDQSYGTLALVNLNEAKMFSERDVAVLAGIGRQTGIAIENARLYQNMRFYVRQVTRAQEEERKRIARELHDDTAQMLVALSRRLDALLTSRDSLPDSVVQGLEQLKQMTAQVLQSVRRFSRGLRPPVLDDLGLLPALEGLKADLASEGIETELRIVGAGRRMSSEVELTLFRIVQEALNNVTRHSEASRVLVDVVFDEGRVKVVIQDNGQGFKVPDRVEDIVATGKLGLIGMQERARLLGGTLAIRSEPGAGTTVIVDVPVQSRPGDA